MSWYAILLPVVLAAQATGQEKQTSPGQKADAKKAGKADAETPKQPRQRPMEIPAEAKEIHPGVWRWVDKSGQPWIYWNSPFGVARSPEKPGGEIKPAAPTVPDHTPAAQAGGVEVEGVTISDEGDNVRFERRTPFGLIKTVKKKSELSVDEKRLWDRAQSARHTPESK